MCLIHICHHKAFKVTHMLLKTYLSIRIFSFTVIHTTMSLVNKRFISLLTDMKSKNTRRSVGILGTGDFARSLAKRLYFSGYDVTLGSRNPAQKALSAIDECFCNIKVVTVDECIKSSAILFIAIHVENFKDLIDDRQMILDGKIIIDVSNRDRPTESHSNAEYLQNLVPECTVVKAFNVISAYCMENDYNTSSRQVFIASDDESARAIVSNIARDMNFRPVDFGGLFSARKIEKHPLRLFPDWRGPIGFTTAVFNAWLLYLIYLYYISDTVYAWEQIFVKVLNKCICMTGITILSVTYLASSFAAMFQLYYGTKHIRFSRWLDKWLKTRKQLGLVSFTLISIHVIMSVLIMSPTYLRSWYHTTEITVPSHLEKEFKFNQVNWMNWKGEAACLTGIIAFVTLCFICVTTFPSVTDTLNWREWRFAQSKLGHVALFMSVVHVLVMGIPGWSKNPQKIYKSITFLCSILPWITLLLKLFFSLPCIDHYVLKIRRGWERKGDSCKAKCGKPQTKVGGYVEVKVEREGAAEGGCPCTGDTYQMVAIEDPGCDCSTARLVRT